jgi:hypothetical protein
MFGNRYSIVLLIVIAACLGCKLLSSESSTSEVVFDPTPVGIPEGDVAKKDIGPQGGSLTSADGRLTLNVPPNVLSAKIAFAIQPISNTAVNGHGSAYRLEPNGQTFTAPIEISLRYDDQDLQGTVPEAFSIAYQDSQGAWRAPKTLHLDKDKKTLTVSTLHFSDWSFLSRMMLSPSKATLAVGVSLPIAAGFACNQSFFNKILGRWGNCSMPAPTMRNWQLQGAGSLEPSGNNVIYTAPAKKPNPNVVHVLFSYEFEQWDQSQVNKVQGTLPAEITIVDSGYKASGQDGRVSYSGLVCDLEKPFEVTTTMGPLSFPTKFRPSSADAGIAEWEAAYGAMGSGGGPYMVFKQGDGYLIVIHMNSTVRLAGRQSSGNADAHITLTPLPGSECGGVQ